MTQPFLAVFWYCLLGFVLLMYVMFDGYDLGVGILSLFAKNEDERGKYLSSIGAVWDANETWLVLFGGMMFGAFPIGYGILLSALYIPVLLFLFGLIFRAVSFEFRLHSKHRRLWGLAFGIGSLAASLGQGFFLGGILNGVKVEDGRFAGAVWDWLSPFTLLLSAGIVSGYVLLGSCYLVRKGTGEPHSGSFRSGLWSAAGVAVFASAAIAVSVVHFNFLAARWFTWPWILLTSIPLIAGAVMLILCARSLFLKKERTPIVYGMLLFAAAFTSLAFSVYPYLVPPSVTLADASAARNTMQAMLIGAGTLLPIIFAYNMYQHWVFRGKSQEEIYED